MTRSKIAQRILDETPQEVRDKVKKYGDELVAKHKAMKDSDRIEEAAKQRIEQWASTHAYPTTWTYLGMIRGATYEHEQQRTVIADLTRQLRERDDLARDATFVAANLRAQVDSLESQLAEAKEGHKKELAFRDKTIQEVTGNAREQIMSLQETIWRIADAFLSPPTTH